jgi:hypothetical protein
MQICNSLWRIGDLALRGPDFAECETDLTASAVPIVQRLGALIARQTSRGFVPGTTPLYSLRATLEAAQFLKGPFLQTAASDAMLLSSLRYWFQRADTARGSCHGGWPGGVHHAGHALLVAREAALRDDGLQAYGAVRTVVLAQAPALLSRLRCEYAVAAGGYRGVPVSRRAWLEAWAPDVGRLRAFAAAVHAPPPPVHHALHMRVAGPRLAIQDPAITALRRAPSGSPVCGDSTPLRLWPLIGRHSPLDVLAQLLQEVLLPAVQQSAGQSSRALLARARAALTAHDWRVVRSIYATMRMTQAEPVHHPARLVRADAVVQALLGNAAPPLAASSAAAQSALPTSEEGARSDDLAERERQSMSATDKLDFVPLPWMPQEALALGSLLPALHEMKASTSAAMEPRLLYLPLVQVLQSRTGIADAALSQDAAALASHGLDATASDAELLRKSREREDTVLPGKFIKDAKGGWVAPPSILRLHREHVQGLQVAAASIPDAVLNLCSAIGGAASCSCNTDIGSMSLISSGQPLVVADVLVLNLTNAIATALLLEHLPRDAAVTARLQDHLSTSCPSINRLLQCTVTHKSFASRVASLACPFGRGSHVHSISMVSSTSRRRRRLQYRERLIATCTILREVLCFNAAPASCPQAEQHRAAGTGTGAGARVGDAPPKPAALSSAERAMQDRQQPGSSAGPGAHAPSLSAELDLLSADPCQVPCLQASAGTQHEHSRGAMAQRSGDVWLPHGVENAAEVQLPPQLKQRCMASLPADMFTVSAFHVRLRPAPGLQFSRPCLCGLHVDQSCLRLPALRSS